MFTSTSDGFDYELRLISTESSTGYFSPFPDESRDFETGLAYARKHPNDEFMRKHLLRVLNGWDATEFRRWIDLAGSGDRFLRALFYEACLLNPSLETIAGPLSKDCGPDLAFESPTIFIRSFHRKNGDFHRRWGEVFRDNIFSHFPLPLPGDAPIPVPFSKREIADAGKLTLTLEALAERCGRPQGKITEDSARMKPEETRMLAEKRLKAAGIAYTEERRHVSSLSPIALMRRWEMRTRVNQGRHRFDFYGDQIAYGRGLQVGAARTACVMEIVERLSAFANFDGNRVTGYRKSYDLISARASDFGKDRIPYMDPNGLNLEVPYQDEKLVWLEGEMHSGRDTRPVWVPAQSVFLFCNLDEPKLFSALGSTGFASGNTLEEAKVSALLEIIERDSENVMPFVPALAFEAESQDPAIGGLLADYARRGIHIRFQDITTPLGVPCCKCYVVSEDGAVAKGTGAHLNARRALLSAMTETPYPYPDGPSSRPPEVDMLRVPFEALPDYSTGTAEQDLNLLETLLTENGFRPIYLDLTREDVGMPVVKALVPGFELMGDFDRFSRISPKLFYNYYRLCEQP